jgi:hypothetical protein
MLAISFEIDWPINFQEYVVRKRLNEDSKSVNWVVLALGLDSSYF